MTATDDLLAEFQPYMIDDDGSLAAMLTGIASGFEPVDYVVRDRANGDVPGWTVMLDANLCPEWALAWLAQIVGITVPAGADPDAVRAAIRTPAGWRRGTVGAIRDAVRPLLTGSQTVQVLERQPGAWPAADDPYHYTVRTFIDETPDVAAVQAAVARQKPAGMIALPQQVTRVTYASEQAAHATYAAAQAAHATYANAEGGP